MRLHGSIRRARSLLRESGMPRRSLWPREHGAYFQLAIPMLTGCLVRAPQVSTVALAIGACLAFLANEPLLVVLGHRGPRMLATDGARARRRLTILAAGAAVLGATGLALAPVASAEVAALVGAWGVVVVLLAWRRAEHTLAGELIACVALTGASAPILVSSGGSPGAAIALWAAWSIGFGAIVVAVHRVLARHKRSASMIDRVVAAVLVATTVVGGLALVTRPVLVAAVPLAALATMLVIVAPSASRLRAIGIATVVVASASGIALVWLT